MKLKSWVQKINLNRVWEIAGSTPIREKELVFVEVSHENLSGVGEASISTRFQESNEKVLEFLESVEGLLGEDPTDIKGIVERLESVKGASPCAIAAIDMALYDMNGKILKKPIYEMLGLNRQDASPSCKTISLAQLSDWKKYLPEFREQRFIKVKVNNDTDLTILQAIYQETGAKLFVDANEAWSAEAALAKCKSMDDWGFIEFIEQPIPANQRASLEKIRSVCKIPIILDEDITTLGSMHRMRNGMDGINIKIQKVGGLYRAIEMITEARKMSKKILLGCRIESSVGITAASHLMPLVDYVDLDSAAMIVNDPYRGAYFNKDTLIIPNSHGLGIISVSRIH